MGVYFAVALQADGQTPAEIVPPLASATVNVVDFGRKLAAEVAGGVLAQKR
jgi:hypothetical protein